MKRALFLGPLLIVLAACNAEPAADDPTVITPDTDQSTSAAPPAAPEPSADGPCPYLDASFVEDTNGQHVGDVKTSADQPPACFFYRPDGGVQMTVRVYTGDAAVAKALVDQAAPVDSSNPAELAGGWAGGAQPTDEGAVYAVAKDKNAIVVTTNQEQTIKAKVVAQEAISALGL
ncbi:MAG: DUF2020 domain-containing protein [Actinophytocola sp.]|uniref:DUF2020 domain-containing protein n=1 Tax=Actinophytocola sp. TaxID=1872138 RepID=UPI0013237AA6|nr:DUF2020 domain-containing protein [Actinophytocola sp.]MPZ85898.1 DUF2020 domain-containing protein [Actinophytocola sp.]